MCGFADILLVPLIADSLLVISFWLYLTLVSIFFAALPCIQVEYCPCGYA